jgi:phage terminase large subunit
MKTQYPSTLDECWEVANDGLWYGKCMEQVRREQRICNVPHDRLIEVHTAWDLGRRDPTAIWFFQLVRKEIRLIDYYENNFEDISHYIKILRDKNYLYGKHYVPHDAGIKSFQTGKSLIDFARDIGISLTLLHRETDILPATNYVRTMLDRCWFDEKRCAKGIWALDNYRKEWSEKNQCYVERELHDMASHGASAFRYLGRAEQLIGGSQSSEEVKAHLDRMNRYRRERV